MKKNVSGQKVGAQMVSATDGSAFTGAVTAYITLDAGTQAVGTVGAGACTHEGNGYHTYAPSQAETNGDLVAVTFVGSGAVPATLQIWTSFPQTTDNQANLPNSGALTTIQADLDDIQTRLPAALVSGRMDASVGAMAANVLTSTAIAADAITAGKIAADAIGASELAADAIAEIQAGLSTLDAAGVRAAVGLASANLDTQLAAIPTANANADALLGRNVAGGSSTGRLVKEALYALRNKWTSVAGVYSVYQTDDTTVSWTSSLATDAAALPLTGSDPA